MKDKEIILIPNVSSPEEIETSIKAFNQPLANLLEHIGLPVDNLLNPIDERRKVIMSLQSVLDILPAEERIKAVYLSKFTVAVTAGLFDGALNYLWDETIKALRRLVIAYDLQYFFNVAETMSARYKNLDAEEDLEAIQEHDLLAIVRRMGLINSLNHNRLQHVNYLRNHASAAHPNEHEISGIEMLSLLENCLKYAIMAKPDHSVIQLHKLFENIRKTTIPDEDVPFINDDLNKQPQVRIDDFIQSLFGIFVDTRQSQETKDNIEKLAPNLWQICSEETKYRIGSKYGLFRKNVETERKDSAQKFLSIVDGLKYKDEDSLAAELIEKLQDLRIVHFSWDNFYNEYPYAKSISQSLPDGSIPDSVKKLFVKIICLCYIGNGKGYRQGVDERAITYYKEFIKRFTTIEIKYFFDLLNDFEFVSDLDKAIPDKRIRKLTKIFKSLTTDIHINSVLDLIIDFPDGRISKIYSVKKFKDVYKNVK